MQKFILSIFLIFLLIPFSQAFSDGEKYDNPSTLSVILPTDRQSVYLDSEGYAVAVGLIENIDSLTAITGVEIQVKFYDEFNSEPLDVVIGSSTLQIIPTNSQSPFAIHSKISNPDITQASVSLLGFSPSPVKEQELTVYSSDISLDTTLKFSGVLQNGGAPNSDTNVYLAFYDGFEPYRILGVSTIELGNVEPDTEVLFDFNAEIDSRAVGFLLFAESDVFYSDFIDVKIPTPQLLTKLVSISDVAVKDTLGNNLSEIPLGSTVNIESKTWVQFASDQSTNETPYTYFVQIKESGKLPYVEYIGKYDGRFIGTGLQSQTIDWIPEKSGLFFIETFVWDRNNVPISEQGPFILINVK